MLKSLRVVAGSALAGALVLVSVAGGATTAFASGSGVVYASPSLNMRTDASTSAGVILSVPYNTTLSIQCVKYGSAVSNSHGTSTLWDYVSYSGRSGFVSDQWVRTGTSAPVAPLCSAAPAPAPAPAPTSTIANYKPGR